MDFKSLNAKQRRAAQQEIARENAKYGHTFREIPRSEWTGAAKQSNAWKVFRNRNFLVSIYPEGELLRLSIARTSLDAQGNFRADISWDELEQIKNEVGFADKDAVEVYPAEKDIVNVANMRHLWVMPRRLNFAWKN